MMMMAKISSREQALVDKIKKFVQRKGGVYYKNPPTVVGRPDIEIFYNSRILIIETKREGAGKIGLEQARQVSKLRQQGVTAEFCDNWDYFLLLWNTKMEQVMKYICTDCGERCTLDATEKPVACALAERCEDQHACDWSELKEKPRDALRRLHLETVEQIGLLEDSTTTPTVYACRCHCDTCFSITSCKPQSCLHGEDGDEDCDWKEVRE